MAFSFSIEDPDTEIQAGFGQVGTEAQEPQQPESVEDMLSEAERRFAKAKYYEVLIRDPIFNDDSSVVGQEVYQEVQVFARDRLSVLLGLKSSTPTSITVPSPFSPEEVDVLRQLAARLLKKPELAGLPPKPSNPTFRKLQAPQAPQGPSVRKVRAPVAAEAPAQPKAQPPKAAAKPKSRDTGEVFKMPQKDGTFRTYKKVKEGDQEIYIGENNQRYAMVINDKGEYYMKGLTVQARPTSGPKPLPPLDEIGIATVAARHARAALNAGTINVTGATAEGGRTAEGGGLSLSSLT